MDGPCPACSKLHASSCVSSGYLLLVLVHRGHRTCSCWRGIPHLLADRAPWEHSPFISFPVWNRVCIALAIVLARSLAPGACFLQGPAALSAWCCLVQRISVLWCHHSAVALFATEKELQGPDSGLVCPATSLLMPSFRPLAA